MVNSMSCSICLWQLCGGKVPWRLVFEPWLEYYWGPGSVFLLRQILCVCVGPAAVAVLLCAGVVRGGEEKKFSNAI
jgi:hypothetical protein